MRDILRVTLISLLLLTFSGCVRSQFPMESYCTYYAGQRVVVPNMMVFPRDYYEVFNVLKKVIRQLGQRANKINQEGRNQKVYKVLNSVKNAIRQLGREGNQTNQGNRNQKNLKLVVLAQGRGFISLYIGPVDKDDEFSPLDMVYFANIIVKSTTRRSTTVQIHAFCRRAASAAISSISYKNLAILPSFGNFELAVFSLVSKNLGLDYFRLLKEQYPQMYSLLVKLNKKKVKKRKKEESPKGGTL